MSKYKFILEADSKEKAKDVIDGIEDEALSSSAEGDIVYGHDIIVEVNE